MHDRTQRADAEGLGGQPRRLMRRRWNVAKGLRTLATVSELEQSRSVFEGFRIAWRYGACHDHAGIKMLLKIRHQASQRVAACCVSQEDPDPVRGDFKTQRLSDMKIYCIRLPLVIGDLMGHRPQTERLTSGEQPLDHEVKVGDRGIKPEDRDVTLDGDARAAASV